MGVFTENVSLKLLSKEENNEMGCIGNVAYTAFLARRAIFVWVVLAIQLYNRKLYDGLFRWKDI